MADLARKLIDFGNQTNGRDKICRFMQYSSKFLADLLDRLDKEKHKLNVLKFKHIDGSISMARKLLRLGKSIEMIYVAKQSLHIKDFMIQSCVTLARIASAFFLLLDNIVWLQKVKAINIDIKPISRLSNQFWLLSIILNLIRNGYDWSRIYNKYARNSTQPSAFVPEQLPTLLDTVRNCCDLLIPIHGLEYVQVAGVIQGATGTLSSIISLAILWNERLKMVNK